MTHLINLKNIYKKFSKYKSINLKEFFVTKRQPTYSKVNREFALKDVSIAINKGESVAILGHNGAGKSTLLSLICGLIDANSGSSRINASLCSMLELTSGINFELTGRENTFLYSSLLKIPLKEIKKNINKIINFSELGSAIDIPVRNYSAGMVARLAFSILMTKRSDVMIIDEVFAVGDHSFKEKCRNFLINFLKKNGTLVMVTHDTSNVNLFCKRGIVLSQGELVFDGNIDDAVSFYKKSLEKKL